MDQSLQVTMDQLTQTNQFNLTRTSQCLSRTHHPLARVAPSFHVSPDRSRGMMYEPASIIVLHHLQGHGVLPISRCVVVACPTGGGQSVQRHDGGDDLAHSEGGRLLDVFFVLPRDQHPVQEEEEAGSYFQAGAHADVSGGMVWFV